MKYALDNPRDLSTVHVTATLQPLHGPVISALITRLFSMNTETEITEMMFVRRLFIYYALGQDNENVRIPSSETEKVTRLFFIFHYSLFSFFLETEHSKMH